MNIGIIYVTRSGECAEREHDPFLKRLRPDVCADVGAPPAEPLNSVIRKVCVKARELQSSGHRCAVVVNAFLDWEAEGVIEGAVWNPSSDALQQLTTGHSSGGGFKAQQRMRCIRLMWAIWEHLRGSVKILVTTDGVHISGRSERAIETAVSEGRVCQMYNWSSNPLVIEDLINDMQGAAVDV